MKVEMFTRERDWRERGLKDESERREYARMLVDVLLA
jgi:hypothetical protein